MTASNRPETRKRFLTNLSAGNQVEVYMSEWLKEGGNGVIDIWSLPSVNGKGPRLKTSDGDIPLPDFLIFFRGEVWWVEVKYKTEFTYYKIEQQWQEGIDLNLWDSYKAIYQYTDLEVWLTFVNSPETAPEKDAPPIPPPGIYTQRVSVLSELLEKESPKRCHVYKGQALYGMVYWDLDAFIRIGEFPKELLGRLETSNEEME